MTFEFHDCFLNSFNFLKIFNHFHIVSLSFTTSSSITSSSTVFCVIFCPINYLIGSLLPQRAHIFLLNCSVFKNKINWDQFVQTLVYPFKPEQITVRLFFPSPWGGLAEDDTCPTDLTLLSCEVICIHQCYCMWLTEECI